MWLMLLRSAFLVICVAVLTGCWVSKNTPQPAKSGYIKGTVVSISQVGNGYVYTINATDTSNGKLLSAQGFSTQRCSVGDLVYARLNGAKFDYFAVLVTGFEQAQEPVIIKKYNRTKQNLTVDSIPVVESIEF